MRQDTPATLFNPGRQHVPPGTGTIGMVLFLVALAMLFGSSILGYLLIRFTARDAPQIGTIHLPLGLWISTILILASSVTMHWSLQAVRFERQSSFRRWLSLTLALAVLFLVVQTPSLMALVHDHLPQVRAYQDALRLAQAQGRPTAGVPMPIGGLVFLLIFVHALHVIGGIVPLVYITWNAHRGNYDHERYSPVKYITMYWHFLDAVWIIMFVTLMLAA